MVKILNSCLIAPQVETPNHGIWLSNLDLLVARAHTPTVYVYKPNGDTSFFSVEVLKTALRNALVLFYPFAGRLGLDPDGGRLQINCNGEGALFVEAQSESTLDEFGDFTPDPKIRQLLVPSVDSGDPPCILLLIQVTFFKCGGVCLGVAVHHTLADGLAALHFINAWSDLARGIDNVAPPPFLDRSLLRAREQPTVLFEHTEYHQNKQEKQIVPAKPFSSTILKLSKEQLAVLKRTGLSSFRAVVAHVWRCACKARGLAGDQPTRLYMTADARSRVTPPLPPGYLGNAIFRSSAASTAGEIMSEPIEFVADKIRATTSRLDDEYVRSLLDFLELQEEDLRRLAKGSWTLPTTDLWVISWQGLPIYEADFGWGKPVFMGRASLQFSGLVYIMHNPNSDGGLSLAVALEPEHILPFQECFFDGLHGNPDPPKSNPRL